MQNKTAYIEFSETDKVEIVNVDINEVDCKTLALNTFNVDEVITHDMTVNSATSGTTIQTDNLELKMADIQELDAPNISTQTCIVDQLTTQELTLQNLSCNTLDVANLVCPSYTVVSLFANQINAATQVQTVVHNVGAERARAAARARRLRIALFVIGAVLAVITVAALAWVGTGVVAIATAAGSSVAITPSLLLGSFIAAAQLSGTFAAASVGAILAGGAAATTFTIAALSPVPVQPNLRTIAFNAAFGKSFLSDTIFGTTSYSDGSQGYLPFLIISNENNTSYLLPRIISYNPELGFFDDFTSYGGVRAYLSLSTYQPNITLRYNADGNLALYAQPNASPIWQSGTQVSSRIYKTNIVPFEGDITLSNISLINGIYFKYKNDPIDRARRAGFTAQNIQQVYPTAVFGTKKTGLRLEKSKLVVPLIAAMKILYAKQQSVLIND